MKKQIWFKAKEYGYGWCPCTWQGFLIILLWVLVFAFAVSTMDHEAGKNLAVIFIATVLLIYICYKKGEKARWRWGNDK